MQFPKNWCLLVKDTELVVQSKRPEPRSEVGRICARGAENHRPQDAVHVI